MKTGTLLAAIFLAVVAIGHVLRLLLQVELVASGYTIPMWVSIPPIVIPILIVYLMFKENRSAA